MRRRRARHGGTWCGPDRGLTRATLRADSDSSFCDSFSPGADMSFFFSPEEVLTTIQAVGQRDREKDAHDQLHRVDPAWGSQGGA